MSEGDTSVVAVAADLEEAGKEASAEGKGKGGGREKGKGKGKNKGKGKKGKGDKNESDGPSALHVAARSGDVSKVLELLSGVGEEEPADVNSGDQHRRTPLHLAAFSGHVEVVRTLLEKSANADREAMDNFLPLHFAAQQGHKEVVHLLVRHAGASGDHGLVRRCVNRVAKGKKSALHLALLKGHTDVARYLAQKGASIEELTAQGQSALDLCSSDELRAELRGAGRKAEVVSSDVFADAPPAKRLRDDSAPQPVDPTRVGADKPEPAEPPREPPAELPPMPGLPAVPRRCEGEGVVASGPWAPSVFEIEVIKGERQYPPGIAQLADVHWTFSAKGLSDGPVWSVVRRDPMVGSSPPRLTLQQSSFKLVVYTHMSDEGDLLPEDSRCNICGVSVLAETSDGFLVFKRRREDHSHLPGLWHPEPAGALDGDGLWPCLHRLFAPWLAVGGSARILGLIAADDAPLEGRSLELVVGVRLESSSAEVAASAAKEGSGALLAFVGNSDQQASEGPTRFLTCEDLIAGTGADQATEAGRRALLLLRELRG